MPVIIGIDLGTTNSLVAFWRDGVPCVIPNSLGNKLTPSVVSVDDDGQILVGQPAKERLLTHPHLTAASFKRRMGTSERYGLGKHSFRPEELTSLVLRALKEDAEHFLGEPVEEAVISVPAYFNATQRKATEIAGELAGFRVERLVNEPTAAALAYGLHLKGQEQQFLVLDLGGGTFDVTVLELFDGIMEVRATAGDNFLGGEDFSNLIETAFLTEHKISPDSLDDKCKSQLRRQAEKAKIVLGDNEETTMSLDLGTGAQELALTRAQFEILAKPLLQRMIAPIERALRDSSINPRELDKVILVGGATRMPLIRKLVTKLFKRFPEYTLSPDEAIVMGAAVQAGLKARNEDLKEVVLTDVAPYTLGIEVSQEHHDGSRRKGIFSPIIERNTIVPASRIERYVTLTDDQTEMRISVYQGESRLVANNIFLGECTVPVPKTKAGEESVDVRFTYDINGLLEVEATSVGSGVKKVLIIEKAPGAMSEEEKQACLQRLAALKLHPRDQLENRNALARAERLYEELMGSARDRLSPLIGHFEQILERQDPREAERARKEFTEQLDSLEKSLVWE